MIKIISWNIQGAWDINISDAAWRCLLESDADIALLQEACLPPGDVAERIEFDRTLYLDGNGNPIRNERGHKISRTAIAALSEQVQMKWLKPVPLAEAQEGDFAVSHAGAISAAIVTPTDGESINPFTVVSFCAEYEKPHCSTGKMSWDIKDASLHRTISDLSLLIGKQRWHRVIAAGDLSIYRGWGEDKSGYWKGRYDTVFDRMEAIGLPMVGPQHCDGQQGRQTKPRPEWLPEGSKNVPTYRHSSGTEHQLDFVFASESMEESVEARALNGLDKDEWGPSDHCRIEITVKP